MLIQKRPPTRKLPSVDNRGKKCKPTGVRIFYPGGKIADGDFPGWQAILLIANEDNVVLRREGAELRIFCVHPMHAVEFWGIA
jgi:hypothetical protein